MKGLHEGFLLVLFVLGLSPPTCLRAGAKFCLSQCKVSIEEISAE